MYKSMQQERLSFEYFFYDWGVYSFYHMIEIPRMENYRTDADKCKYQEICSIQCFASSSALSWKANLKKPIEMLYFPDTLKQRDNVIFSRYYRYKIHVTIIFFQLLQTIICIPVICFRQLTWDSVHRQCKISVQLKIKESLCLFISCLNLTDEDYSDHRIHEHKHGKLNWKKIGGICMKKSWTSHKRITDKWSICCDWGCWAPLYVESYKGWLCIKMLITWIVVSLLYQLSSFSLISL